MDNVVSLTAPDMSGSVRAISSRALRYMETHGVASTPRNYEIWYAYAHGEHGELARVVDAEMAVGRLWTDEFADDVHRRFFSSEHDMAIVAEVNDALGSEIASLMRTITDAGAHTRSYDAVLDVAANQMERETDAVMSRAVVRQLAAATKAMRARADALETELARASVEVETLRKKNEAIRKEANTDSLTGLANRKHFDDQLRRAGRSLADGEDAVCVIMGDVDHFKSFNDTWGHQTGDQVLRLVAGCFADNVKGRDTAARYGGEEFAVLLPSTSLANACKLAEQIRASVQTRKVIKRSTGETLGSITISLGVAQLRRSEATYDFVRRVDSCLYAAKAAGRNVVVNETQLPRAVS